MPGLRPIKNRIKAIDDIARITGALEIVALTRLKKRQGDCLQRRIYFDKIRAVLNDITRNINFYQHPVLVRPESGNKVGLILIGSDKGLCGNFNNNIIETVRRKIKDEKLEFYQLVIFGKRIMRNLEADAWRVTFKMDVSDIDNLAAGISSLAKNMIDSFLKKKIGAWYLIYNHFHQQFLGRAKIIRLLPLELRADKKEGRVRDYIYQPNQEEIFNFLIKEYLKVEIYHAITESRVSEEMARMVAMKQATDNAKELLQKLNLGYHKLRQTNITRDLLDIMTAIRE